VTPCTGWISTLGGRVDDLATGTPLVLGGKRRTTGTGPPASPCESVLTMVDIVNRAVDSSCWPSWSREVLAVLWPFRICSLADTNWA
jgi:hypothetical protein